MIAQVVANWLGVIWRPSPPVADLFRPWNHANSHGVIYDPSRGVEPFAAQLGNQLPSCHPLNGWRDDSRSVAAGAARVLPGHKR
jgi:hypothetical protein